MRLVRVDRRLRVRDLESSIAAYVTWSSGISPSCGRMCTRKRIFFDPIGLRERASGTAPACTRRRTCSRLNSRRRQRARMPAASRRTPRSTAWSATISQGYSESVRDHSEHGFGRPRCVEREREKFLASGLLCHGFVRVRCDHCAGARNPQVGIGRLRRTRAIVRFRRRTAPPRVASMAHRRRFRSGTPRAQRNLPRDFDQRCGDGTPSCRALSS